VFNLIVVAVKLYISADTFAAKIHRTMQNATLQCKKELYGKYITFFMNLLPFWSWFHATFILSLLHWLSLTAIRNLPFLLFLFTTYEFVKIQDIFFSYRAQCDNRYTSVMHIWCTCLFWSHKFLNGTAHALYTIINLKSASLFPLSVTFFQVLPTAGGCIGTILHNSSADANIWWLISFNCTKVA